MPSYRGQCHCGNLEVLYTSDIDPADAEVRACDCAFCRRHAARCISDPEGRMEIKVRDPELLNRYRFGLGTADFYLCHNCGVYVGAVMPEPEQSYAIVNINVFEERDRFTRPAADMSYGAEDEAGRRARRRAKWTPVNAVS